MHSSFNSSSSSKPDAKIISVSMEQERDNEPTTERSGQLPVEARTTANMETISHLPSILVHEPGNDENKEHSSHGITISLTKAEDNADSKTIKPTLTSRRKSHQGPEIPGRRPNVLVKRSMSTNSGKEDNNSKKKADYNNQLAVSFAVHNTSTFNLSKTDTETLSRDAEDALEAGERTEFIKGLMEAIKKGDCDKLHQLIRENQDFQNIKIGKSQETPLIFALRNGGDSTLCLAKTILSFNPDVNASDINGRTALMLASGRGLREVVEALLRCEAWVDVLGRWNETALFDAASTKIGGDVTKVVELLLEWHADPNLADTKGRTPLHMAALRGYYEIVERLLSVDITDVNSKSTISGYTPLHVACSEGHVLVVKALLENGADVDAKSSKNWTPLHIAAKKGNAKIVEDLLQAGADTMLYTQTLDTPETLVPKNDENGIVELLKRKDLSGNRTAQSLSKELNARKLSPEQAQICKAFKGFIWPSVDKSYRYDTLTVWDMLYSESPKLEKLKGHLSPVWIHLPANVMNWVEDIFKFIYAEGNKNPKGKNKENSKDSHSTKSSDAALYNIFQFLDTHFGELGRHEYARFRQPHYKCAIGPRPRLRTYDNRMISLVIPILDVDMQQPCYYSPSEYEMARNKSDSKKTGEAETSNNENIRSKTRRLVKKYTTSEGRPLRIEEKKHVRNMKQLASAYNGHQSRTLDESVYMLLDECDSNYRNGDQVLSRFLGRLILRIKGDKEDTEDDEYSVGSDRSTIDESQLSDLDEPQNQERIETTIDTSTHITASAMERKSTEEKNQVNSPSVANDLARTGSSTKDTQDPIKELTPYELENQANGEYSRKRKWLANIASKFKKHEESLENSAIESLPKTDDDGYYSAAGSYAGDSNDDGKGANEEPPRQQILVVPQLWIWKVENIIITAYPDRWDSSNPRALSKIMLANVEERNKIAKKEKILEDMDIQGLLHSMIDSCFGFEPLFSAFNEDQSYSDAFSTEISYISNQVATCYGNYRESLGNVGKSFVTDTKEETELLIDTDDILTEIAMIKRTHEDQCQVCTEMKAEEDAIAKLSKNNLGPSPWHGQGFSKRHGTMHHSSSDDTQLEIMSSQASHRSRPTPSPRLNTKLVRLEEDARRVRKSIITLLDLRQKQASTENAINSGRQSRLLFEQSKVLFIFTGATVIFAPLSWISSLLALNIEHFTPNAWRIDQAFGASFGSLMSTLLLCFVFWKAYGHYFNASDSSKANKNSRNWVEWLPWRTMIRRPAYERTTSGSITFGTESMLVSNSSSPTV